MEDKVQGFSGVWVCASVGEECSLVKVEAFWVFNGVVFVLRLVGGGSIRSGVTAVCFLSIDIAVSAT